jgi:hypothetical protein
MGGRFYKPLAASSSSDAGRRRFASRT